MIHECSLQSIPIDERLHIYSALKRKWIQPSDQFVER